MIDATATPGAPIDGVADSIQAETPAVKPQEDQEFSKKFAALAKRERLLRQKEEQAKAQWDAVQRFEQARKQAKSNPLGFLEEAGLSYQEITDYLLNDSKPSPDAQIQALREQIEQERRERQEAEERKKAEGVEGTIKAFKAQI